MIPLGILAAAPTIAAPPSGLIVTDDFNRADGALGLSTSGHPWAFSGGSWSIVSGGAKVAYSSGRPCAWHDAGSQSMYAAARIATTLASQYPFVAACWVDEANCYQLVRSGTALQVALRSGGKNTDMRTEWNAGITDTTLIGLRVVQHPDRTDLTVVLDGVDHWSTSDTTAGRPMGTKGGIGVPNSASASGAVFDDFRLEAL